jgi:hypothetical protein
MKAKHRILCCGGFKERYRLAAFCEKQRLIVGSCPSEMLLVKRPRIAPEEDENSGRQMISNSHHLRKEALI